MSVFATKIQYKPWVWQIAMLAFVLGGVLAASLKTQDQIRQEQLPTTRINGLAAAYSDLRDANAEMKKKLGDVESRLKKYQEAAGEADQTNKLLSADLQKATLLAGQKAVKGPGIVVTLKDSKNSPAQSASMTPSDYQQLSQEYIIHDSDIQMVINELKAAGAEAMAINDQRVVSTTGIRCVGPVVNVNGTPTNGSPVKIRVIGDPDTLLSALTISGGVASKFFDPSMIQIDKVKEMVLPAFVGATPNRWAQPADEAEAEAASKKAEESAATAQTP